MKPIFDFSINGVKASSVGLVVERPDPPPMAAQRYNTFTVGRDSDLVVPDDSFDDLTYPIKARVIAKQDDFDNAAIYSFLNGARTLKLSNLPQYYFRIRKVAGIEPIQKHKGNEITYQITFQLAPFKYISAEPIISLTSAGIVFNAGTRYSEPQYIMNLSAYTGSGTLTVNGQTVTFSIPTSINSLKLIIDAENMLAYDGNNVIRTKLTSGIFPYLASGNNYVSFSGIVQSVEIQRNGRCY